MRGEVRERRKGDEEEEQKVQGGERGSDGRESPTSAVTTTRLAAAAADCDCCSNKAGSCHKHLLFNTTRMYSHLRTHTDAARVALCAFPLYGSQLSFFLFFLPLLPDKTCCDCPLLSIKYDGSITYQIKMSPRSPP